MKKWLRLIAGFLYVFPFFIFIYITAIIIGRKKSVIFWGKIFNFIITKLVELTLIPKIKSQNEFNLFRKKMKQNLIFLKPFYDVEVSYEDENKIIMRYNNCPHCDVFKILGLPEICPLICQSDWDIAEKNLELWHFERSHQIGTGDAFCNHTYIKKNKD